MKYYLIAGEASGDLHASRLMHEIKQLDPAAQFRYYGGDAMQSEGGTLVQHYSELAYMGFVEVLIHLDIILSNMSRCKKDIAAFQPDALILVDYPGFNLGIAKWVRTHLPQTKVCYYISPKIWAWKSYRIKSIRRNVDLMLSILPFEVDWYHQRDYEVTYVGNPTVDELYPMLQHPLVDSATDPYVLLVPGSRKAEVRANLHIMLEATQGMGPRIIAGAPGLGSEFYAEVLSSMPAHADVQVCFGETHRLMRNARVAAVTSGTAALEAAYLRCPQVVCYRVGGGKFFYNVMKQVLRNIRYVSLVNLLIYGISGDKSLPDERHAAVCELLGPYLTPANLRVELEKIFPTDAPARLEMLRQYDRMAERLGSPGAPQRAAEAIMRLFPYRG